MYSAVLPAMRSNLFNAPHFQLATEVNTPGRPESSDPTDSSFSSRRFAAASTTDETSCEFGSGKYYALCGFGGILSCGITHTAIVPLDLVKCRIQVDPLKYKNIFNGFSITLKEDGTRGLAKGWAPTFFGYSMQGLCKFGFYEIFKNVYSSLLGEEKTYVWRTSLYLAASASAEFFADIALAPMEACKVRMQTQPGFANTLREAAPKMYAQEGVWAFYKGVAPLWMRQIPYTMMKFACFERTVEALYLYVVPKPRSDCSKPEQLVVTFVAGYIAGVFCAIVSHPPDTVVSVLNTEKGSSALQVLKRLGMKGRSLYYLGWFGGGVSVLETLLHRLSIYAPKSVQTIYSKNIARMWTNICSKNLDTNRAPWYGLGHGKPSHFKQMGNDI
uniref:Solute carrier family 25 member 3 n=1 Tax=Eptatretus burgeri TaxID=7764 RepID=A0A8C4QY57_EPTBU